MKNIEKCTLSVLKTVEMLDISCLLELEELICSLGNWLSVLMLCIPNSYEVDGGPRN